jgi:hypothetical protein
MFNAKLAPVLVMVGVTAAMWGCGDDDKPSGTGGRAGAAGSSGKGGTAGKGGAAGMAGKGGSGGATGGRGGTGGKGGTAGKGGAAGSAGTTGGTAGATMGGQGGEGGDAPGGAGGAGGEGGGGSLSLEDACAAICADQEPLDCDTGCLLTCIGLATETEAPTEYNAMIQCEAAELGPSDYTCHEPSVEGPPDVAGPAFDGPCETELCAWSCAETLFAEENTRAHCGC